MIDENEIEFLNEKLRKLTGGLKFSTTLRKNESRKANNEKKQKISRYERGTEKGTGRRRGERKKESDALTLLK